MASDRRKENQPDGSENQHLAKTVGDTVEIESIEQMLASRGSGAAQDV
jgi:hypothetical protein